ncbi:MAG: ABC transporter permease, partial [Treponema sp.]|nr:ABC transporter permease [Treponema sp.]
MLANKFSKDNVKSFLADKLVAEIFLALTIISIPLSGYSGKFIIDEILTRIARNSFLVFSLVLPIMAGMGINFGMVLGAMAGQIGLIFAMDWNISGLQGLVFAMLVGIPISVVLGFVAGTILNHARGREMVTSYILGFFFNGIYQFVVLYLFGSIIPLHNKAIALSRGWGVRNTLNLDPVRQALDNVLLVRISGVKVPLSTYIVVALLALFIVWFKRTKLGQDMRSVGLSQSVSRSQGIPVEMTRVVAI